MSVLFIIDNDAPNTTALVANLGKHSINVYLSSSLLISSSVFSKYVIAENRHCKTGYSAFGQKSSYDAFIADIIALIHKWEIKVLIPLSSPALIPISVNKERIQRETGVEIPIPDYGSLLQFHDKRYLIKLAKECGIPYPRSYIPRNFKELEGISSREEYPLLIKPNIGRGGGGIQIAANKSELLSKFKKALSYSEFPIIQEYISGEKNLETNEYIVSLLFGKNSEVQGVFCLRRIRTYPSVLVNCPVSKFTTFAINEYREDLVQYAIKILKHVKWYGVASAQFKIDKRDQKPKLLEVNPRLAGITPFAVKCGINFPLLLYRMSLDKNIGKVAYPKESLKYSAFHKDIIVGARDFWQSKTKLRYIKFFLNSYKGSVYFVDLDFTDLLPYLLFFFRNCLRKYLLPLFVIFIIYLIILRYYA
jgi:predicted ATP-grasp superfamily ATP-dependent carboligase